MQGQDAKLLDLREQANNALQNGQQLQEKNIQITVFNDILNAKHKNYKHWKPILPQNMIRDKLLHTHGIQG